MAEALEITLVRGLAGKPRKVKSTVRGLGLRKVRHTVTLQDTPSIRGMVREVQHMLRVQVGKVVNLRQHGLVVALQALDGAVCAGTVRPVQSKETWDELWKKLELRGLTCAYQLRSGRLTKLPNIGLESVRLPRPSTRYPKAMMHHALYGDSEALIKLLHRWDTPPRLREIAALRLSTLDEKRLVHLIINYPQLVSKEVMASPQNNAAENTLIPVHSAVSMVELKHGAARALMRDEKFFEARELLMEAYDVLSQSNIDSSSLVWGYLNRALGYVNARIGNQPQTIDAYERALDVWSNIGDLSEIIRCHLALAASSFHYAKMIVTDNADKLTVKEADELRRDLVAHKRSWIAKTKRHLHQASDLAGAHPAAGEEFADAIRQVRQMVETVGEP